MRTLNAARITTPERAHLAKVKATACALCDCPPPVEAHHIVQGDHMATVGVCTACHRGPSGIHGDGAMLRLRFGVADLRAQVRALNVTLARVAALEDE